MHVFSVVGEQGEKPFSILNSKSTQAFIIWSEKLFGIGTISLGACKVPNTFWDADNKNQSSDILSLLWEQLLI